MILAISSFTKLSPGSMRVSDTVDKRIQINDSYCFAGNEAVIIVLNVGNAHITVAPGGDVTMTDMVSGSELDGSWYPIESNSPTIRVAPGDLVWSNASCTGLCRFSLDVGGREYIVSVQC